MTRRAFLAATAALTAGPAMARPDWIVPPEEAPHQRTFMMWPQSRQVYDDAVFLDIVQDTIADIANTIAAFEPVTLLAHPDAHAAIRQRVSSAVELWDIPTDDLWARDAGPLFTKNAAGDLAVSHIRFNGWGDKQTHLHEGRVAADVAGRLGLDLIESGLVGEPGGVDHDGHGLLMAHESSWVIGNRNPGLDRDAIGRRLLAAYGAERILWSPGVRGQDITDYHIDSLARFTGPGRVLINLPDEPDMRDPFHRAAHETHAVLQATGLDIEVIPEPNIRRINSPDFVASYANFYVCNGAVIAAQFGDSETDAIAADALARHYPGREIVTLNVDALGEIGGGIHCATQQMPA
ncbi:MAG: agmatine deiminase family protein [Rhodobacter sp.]|nr:agmatine deiminase family protein [Rhodobacter sp.]